MRRDVHSLVRGLYGMADADAARGDPARLAVALIAARCRVVQLRCKGWSTKDIVRAARDVLPASRAAGAALIINDDAEACVASGADGLHIGQTDGPVASWRGIIGPDRLLGVSCHQTSDLTAAARYADYLAFGPVFATPNLSRPKPVRGLDGLGAARLATPTSHPLVAIGGITLANVGSVIEAGADAWAVISAVASADDPETAARAFMAFTR